MRADPVLAAVERSNQRGGRMLSVVDLLEAGTLSRPMACRILHAIEDGAGWLVGARPGGAGKTTIMSALLALLPADEPLHLTTADGAWRQAPPGACVVAYELSPGHYDAYVWGAAVRDLVALGAAGRRIVSNLHADALAEARAQVERDCGVPPPGTAAFDLFLPIERNRRGVPQVPVLYDARGGDWQPVDDGEALSDREEAVGERLDRIRAAGLRTCTEVRRAWLA